VIFPIGIDIGAALIYAGFISGSETTTETLSLVFFGGQEHRLHFLMLLMLMAYTLLAITLLFVGVALLVTRVGFG